MKKILHSKSILMMVMMIAVNMTKDTGRAFQFAKEDEILVWDMGITFQLQVYLWKIACPHRKELKQILRKILRYVREFT